MKHSLSTHSKEYMSPASKQGQCSLHTNQASRCCIGASFTAIGLEPVKTLESFDTIGFTFKPQAINPAKALHNAKTATHMPKLEVIVGLRLFKVQNPGVGHVTRRPFASNPGPRCLLQGLLAPPDNFVLVRTPQPCIPG